VHGQPGQRLKLEIDNDSATLHNISIPGQQVDVNLPPHGTVEVDVTVPQDGALAFICKFHTALGMNGELLAGDTAPQPAAGG
jgi:plastocyanin